MGQIEQRELSGNVTVNTLRKTAAAMDCELVYYFQPKKSLNVFIQEQAIKKATRIADTTDLHMSLEDQRVTTDFNKKVQRLAKKLIEQRKVW